MTKEEITFKNKVIFRKPRLDQGADYERGFIDGMQYQMQTSVDKAVNAMSQQEQGEPVAWMYDWTTSDGEHIKNWTTSEAETLHDTESTIITNIRPLYTTPQTKEWVGLIRGVRVEGNSVIIVVNGNNDEARFLCKELINEMTIHKEKT